MDNIQDDIQLDFDFEEWFDIFIDECKRLGYTGAADKYSFENDWETGKTPSESAQSFVSEMLA